MLRAGTCQPSPVAALRASHTGRLRSHPDAVRAQRCPEPGGNFWPVISADLIRDDQSAPHVGHDGGRVLLAVGCRRHERERNANTLPAQREERARNTTRGRSFSNCSCPHERDPADWTSVDQTTSALRKEMVDRLVEAGTIKSPSVENAMSQIPRHLFVPQISTRAAYLDQAVMVKRAKDGSPISSASQPTIVAIMLEQLQVSPGHRVLEVGTGSGYNAALLGALCGPNGLVVTIELEPELAERAAQVLAQLGLDQIQVVIGDGRDGYAPQEPYDRVIVHGGRTRNCNAVVEAVARPRSTGDTARRSEQSWFDCHVREHWGRVETAR